MFYSKKITEMLRRDTALRLKVALTLGVTEQSIHLGIRHRRKSLLDIRAVNTIKAHTGLSEAELFETEATA